MPKKFGKAIGYSIVLWMVGIIWGSIVFMVPSWKDVAEVPYISQNPVMSIPNLIFYLILIYFFSKSYLKGIEDKKSGAGKFALTMFVVNLILDNLFIILFAGDWPNYLATLSVVFAYLMMIIIPMHAAERLQRKK